MTVEILFISSSAPKVHENVYAVYTKGGLLCVHLDDGLIMKYPMVNVFSVAHQHGNHLGSVRGMGKRKPYAYPPSKKGRSE